MITSAPLRQRSVPLKRTTAPDRRRLYRHRSRVADLLVIMMWASGALAAALFLETGGSTHFNTPTNIVTSVGVIAGLIGTDFILVMLVLAARIPLLDRTVGHDRAIAVHRSLGKPALYLLLAHGALLLTGYGMSSGFNPIAEIGPMLAIPNMSLAFIAMALLIVVVVTSLVAVRRRFSYEGWHLVHLLSYVSVAFAIPHQLTVGSVFGSGTVERVYWITLYVVAFGSIATYRFIEPVVASLRHRITVDRVETVAPGVVNIHLTGFKLTALEAAGGQFFVWRFWTARTWWHSHPITLSAMPAADHARITVRDLGGGSRAISAAQPGTRVSVEGPYGLFTDVGRTSASLAIIVAGIGITPARALLEDSIIAPGDTILLRASNADESYLWDEVVDLARAKGATVYTMVGPRSATGPGWMPQADAARGVTLASIFPHLNESDLYICGPTAWLDLVEADARANGIPDHQIHTERFNW